MQQGSTHNVQHTIEITRYVKKKRRKKKKKTVVHSQKKKIVKKQRFSIMEIMKLAHKDYRIAMQNEYNKEIQR